MKFSVFLTVYIAVYFYLHWLSVQWGCDGYLLLSTLSGPACALLYGYPTNSNKQRLVIPVVALILIAASLVVMETLMPDYSTCLKPPVNTT